MLEKEMKIGKGAWKEFASLLGNLPLESCIREHIAVTKEWGWKAPQDKTFRISGHFIIDSSQSDVVDHCMPLQSADMLKEEHPKAYKEFLEEAEGNESEALDLLVDDLFEGLYSGTPVSFFDGKWLVISPDLKQEPEVKETNGLDALQIKVKSDIQAWVEREYLQAIDDVSPQSSIVTDVLFASQILAKKWKQYFAEAVLDKCGIEIVDSTEKEEGLYILKPKDTKHLFLPDEAKKEGASSGYEFFVSTRKRTGGEEKKQIKDFARDTVLTFNELSGSNLLVACRSNELIQPSKLIIPKKKRERSQDIPF